MKPLLRLCWIFLHRIVGLGMSERLSRDVEMQKMGSIVSEYADTDPIGQETLMKGLRGLECLG